MINLLNHWRGRLCEWTCWLKVLTAYGQDEAWSLRNHFVVSLVFYCMHQPSATRDRFGGHATEVVHQANLVVDSTYVDKLDQDTRTNPILSRKDVESSSSESANLGPVLAV